MRYFLAPLVLSIVLVGCGSGGDKTEVTEVVAKIQEDSQYSYTYSSASDTTAVVTSNPQNGSVTLSNTGFTYIPSENYFGQDSATIEVGNVIYQLLVDVEEVNDAPVLLNNSLSVSANLEMTGALEATDIDGDVLTFTLVKQPFQGQVELNPDGSFTFTTSELAIPDTSFVVKVSDGRGGEIESTIELSAAYSSNEDKSNYYYSSTHSHLRKAEERIANIEDDSLVASAYEALAIGYVNAAFDNKVRSIIDTKIPLQVNKYAALAEVANAYERIGKQQLANEYRLDSLNVFLKYVSDNDIENISPTEVQSLIDLVDDFRNSGNVTGIEKATSALLTVTEQLKSEEHDRRYVSLIDAQRTSLVKYVDYYLALPDNDPAKSDTYEYAVNLLKEFAELSYNVGYQEITSGDLAGQHYYSVGISYLVPAVQYAMVLNNNELAKDYMARIISFYAPAIYDEKHSYSERQFSENTYARYKFGLAYASPYFSILYPDIENIALDIANLQQPEDRSLILQVERNLPVSEALQALNRGEDLNQIITQLDYYNPDDPYTQQNLLVGRSSLTLALAQGLFNEDRDEEALGVIELGFGKIKSEKNISENITRTLRIVGRSGCGKYLSIYQARGYEKQAIETVASCASDIVEPYLSSVTNDVELEDVLTSYKTLSDYYLTLNDYAKSQAALDVVRIQEDGTVYDLSDFAGLAINYMASKNYSAAIEVINHAANVALASESAVDYRTTQTLVSFAEYISLYDRYSSSNYNYTYNLQAELRRSAFNEENYANMLDEVKKIATMLNTLIGNNLAELAVEDQLRLAGKYVDLLASNRQYDEAEVFIEQLDAGEVEKRTYLVNVSVIQSLQDDFPSSTIANVDTDGDGRANFYAINATEEELSNTTIILDNDADGDGILDDQDINPLD